MQVITIGAWTLKFCEETPLSPHEGAALAQFLNERWLPVFQGLHIQFPWMGLKEHDIPSPFIRIDMGCDQLLPVEQRIYEIEERPAGIGLFLKVFPEQFPRVRAAFRHCEGFVHCGGPIQDDVIAAEVLGLPFHNGLNGFQSCWFRHDTLGRHQTYDHDFLGNAERISLVPVRQDGHKATLLALGLAKKLDEYLFSHGGNLPWEEGFCIKPLQGTWTDGTVIFDPAHKRKCSTKSQVLRMVTERGEGNLILQPLIHPEHVTVEGRDYCKIHRVFFAYDYDENAYHCVGGFHMATPSLKVHGTSEARTGILRLPSQ